MALNIPKGTYRCTNAYDNNYTPKPLKRPNKNNSSPTQPVTVVIEGEYLGYRLSSNTFVQADIWEMDRDDRIYSIVPILTNKIPFIRRRNTSGRCAAPVIVQSNRDIFETAKQIADNTEKAYYG